MGERKTYKCHTCKQIFLTQEMVAEIQGKQTFHYCQKCHNERVEEQEFMKTVCEIFGLKRPGSRIWKDRAQLKNDYGYTDQTIIDCLNYIYNVKNMKKLSNSLCLVKPQMVNEMMNWKRINANKGQLMAAAAQQVKEEKI